MDRAAFIKLLTNLSNPDLADAVARRITFEMKRAGLTWDKVVGHDAFFHFHNPGAVRPPGATPWKVFVEWGKIAQIADKGVLRSKAESDFLLSIEDRPSLTPGQQKWFDDIKARAAGIPGAPV